MLKIVETHVENLNLYSISERKQLEAELFLDRAITFGELKSIAEKCRQSLATVVASTEMCAWLLWRTISAYLIENAAAPAIRSPMKPFQGFFLSFLSSFAT